MYKQLFFLSELSSFIYVFYRPETDNFHINTNINLTDVL